MGNYNRPILFVLLIVTAAALYFSEVGQQYLDLENLQARLESIKEMHLENKALFTLGFVGLYVLITGFSIPGSIVLTLLAGSTFGTWPGSLIVTMSSTLGACVSFFIAKFFLRDFVTSTFSRQFKVMNSRIKSDGPFYLFVLRLIPVSPFVVINLVMGVTNMKPWTYAWITFFGMFPGTLIYVIAGKKISEIKSLTEIMSAPLIIALLLLGLIPIVGKKALRRYVKTK